jgi:hypothetical protein
MRTPLGMGLIIGFALASTAVAQTGQPSGAGSPKAVVPAPPHELSGVWEFARVPNQAPTLRLASTLHQ